MLDVLARALASVVAALARPFVYIAAGIAGYLHARAVVRDVRHYVATLCLVQFTDEQVAPTLEPHEQQAWVQWRRELLRYADERMERARARAARMGSVRQFDQYVQAALLARELLTGARS